MAGKLRRWWLSWLLVAACWAGLGCYSTQPEVLQTDIPRELAKVSLPEYVIEPPDILLINALRLIPLPPYRIEPLDTLVIQSLSSPPAEGYQIRAFDQIAIQVNPDEILPMQPIDGLFAVDPEGKINLGYDYGSVSVRGMTVPAAKRAVEAHLKRRFRNLTEIKFVLVASESLQPLADTFPVDVEGKVNLGPAYGSVPVAGLTVEEAARAIERHLSSLLADPKVTVSIGQSRGIQMIQGEHLVRPDGTVSLGRYGSVRVAGLTLDQAKEVLTAHLSQYLQDPEITVDIGYYSSKYYYIITDGGGFGEQVFRFNITGNETVLDAMSQIAGLPTVASKHHIWIARPAPSESGCEQILPVDWNALARRGATATNYQLFPGDRIYVKADPLITIDSMLTKLITPAERIFGVTLLANGTIRSFERRFGRGGVGGFGF